MTHAPSTAATLPAENARIPVLDGIRGLAVLLVVAFHTLFTADTAIGGATLNALRAPLWAGVDLFFVLSGFLITGILLDTKSNPRYFRNFYLRRTLRIFPLYYGVLFAVLVVAPLALAIIGRERPGFLNEVLPRQLWLWSYLQNWLQATGPHTLPGFGHFWTLAVEEQFYMIWPLVVFALTPRRLLHVCVFAAGFGVVLRTVLLTTGVADNWALRHMTITRADSLLIGAGLALLLRNAEVRARIRRFAPAVLGVTVAAIALIYGAGGELTRPLVATIGYSLMAFAGAALIAISLDKPFLDRPFLRLLGKYSYALYVFHLPIAVGVKQQLDARFPSPAAGVPNAFAAFVITMAVTLVLAMISWRLWEAPWLSLKDRFASYGPAPEPTEPKYARRAAAEMPAP